MVIKKRYILLIVCVFIFLIKYSFSERVLVHYDNVDNPINIRFDITEMRMGGYSKTTNKQLLSGSVRFNKPTPNGLGVFTSAYYGMLTVFNNDGNKVSEVDMLEDIKYESCKIDVYLDKNGQVIKVVETDNQIPFICF